jgi:hypothetical protein
LKAKHTPNISDEFYHDTIKDKSIFKYQLKERLEKALNPQKANKISAIDKISFEFLVNKLIEVEKRRGFNEYKQRKHKKKINRVKDDMHDSN